MGSCSYALLILILVNHFLFWCSFFSLFLLFSFFFSLFFSLLLSFHLSCSQFFIFVCEKFILSFSSSIQFFRSLPCVIFSDKRSHKLFLFFLSSNSFLVPPFPSLFFSFSSQITWVFLSTKLLKPKNKVLLL